MKRCTTMPTRTGFEVRGKLEPHGVALRSIRGFGYRLELAQQA